MFFIFCGVMLANGDIGFDENYHVTWGFDHALYQDGGREMQLYLDQYTGYHHLPHPFLPLIFVRRSLTIISPCMHDSIQLNVSVYSHFDRSIISSVLCVNDI